MKRIIGKSDDLWETEDGVKLSRPVRVGRKLIFKHPETGEDLIATFGAIKENGEFFKICRKPSCIDCTGRDDAICRHGSLKYLDSVAYYVDL